MKYLPRIFIVYIAVSTGGYVFASGLTHDEETGCLSFMMSANVFGDEVSKSKNAGPNRLVSMEDHIGSFEAGDYIPKLDRIKTAAQEGNLLANSALAQMHSSGLCGLPQGDDLSYEYMAKAGSYLQMAMRDMMISDKMGEHEEGLIKGIVWLKVSLLKYPFLSESSVLKVFHDRGNDKPKAEEVRSVMNSLQPPKEQIENQLDMLIRMASLKGTLTEDDINRADKAAKEWVSAHQ